MGKAGMWVDTDTRSYMIAMDMISKTALPEAIAETLNVTADATTKEQVRNAKKDFTLRTAYTLRSMESGGAKPYKALNKARGKKITRMYSRAGTYSKYLWLQEENRTVRGLTGAVPIPTLAARASKSIKKSVRKTYRLNSGESLQDGPLGATGKRFIGTAKGGNRRRGIYLRSGNNHRLTMIRNLESDSIRIKGTGFHEKAVRRYGTVQFIRAQFKRIATARLRRVR